MLSRSENAEIRRRLGEATNLDDFRNVVLDLKAIYGVYDSGEKVWEGRTTEGGESRNLVLPPWICQPYVRIPPEEHLKKVLEKQEQKNDDETGSKRMFEDSDGNQISRKRMKKLRRIQRRPEKSTSPFARRPADKCGSCANPLGSKCEYKICKVCCKAKCFAENLDCVGHKILVRTRRNLAKKFAELEKCQNTAKITAES